MSVLDPFYKRAFEHLYEALGWARERYTRQRLGAAAFEALLVIRGQAKQILQLEEQARKLRKDRDHLHEALQVTRGEREECDAVLRRVREIHMIDWATGGNLVARETLVRINEALGDDPDFGTEQGEKSPASGIQEHRGTAQYPHGSNLPAASSGCEAPPAQEPQP